jgi:ATP-dependent 26S proteasome regulatory subunit
MTYKTKEREHFLNPSLVLDGFTRYGPNLAFFCFSLFKECLNSEETLFELTANGETNIKLFPPILVENIPSLKCVYSFVTGIEKQTEFALKDKDTYIHLETDGVCRCITLNKEKLNLVTQLFRENIHQKQTNTAYVITSSTRGLDLQSIGQVDFPFEEGNYTPEVTAAYGYILKELNNENPKGRLAILYGPPGSGKTSLIKSLFSKLENSQIIVLPSSLVGQLDGPNFLGLFLSRDEEFKKKPITLIIEDADDCLSKRSSHNATSVSTILNLADGIIGSCLDIRILATTNVKQLDLDEALLRAGRILSCIGIEELLPEQASVIYKRLTGQNKTYDSATILSDIYADANEASVKQSLKPQSLRIGF